MRSVKVFLCSVGSLKLCDFFFLKHTAVDEVLHHLSVAEKTVFAVNWLR